MTFQHATDSSLSTLFPFALIAAVALTGFSAMVGCGPSQELVVANHSEVRSMMNELSKAEGDLEVIADLFVEGAAPDESWLKEIKGKLIELGDITFLDTEATVPFTIETYTGEIVSQGEWKCIHKDDRWWISEAPIPKP